MFPRNGALLWSGLFSPVIIMSTQPVDLRKQDETEQWERRDELNCREKDHPIRKEAQSVILDKKESKNCE